METDKIGLVDENEEDLTQSKKILTQSLLVKCRFFIMLCKLLYSTVKNQSDEHFNVVCHFTPFHTFQRCAPNILIDRWERTSYALLLATLLLPHIVMYCESIMFTNNLQNTLGSHISFLVLQSVLPLKEKPFYSYKMFMISQFTDKRPFFTCLGQTWP